MVSASPSAGGHVREELFRGEEQLPAVEGRHSDLRVGGHPLGERGRLAGDGRRRRGRAPGRRISPAAQDEPLRLGHQCAGSGAVAGVLADDRGDVHEERREPIGFQALHGAAELGPIRQRVRSGAHVDHRLHGRGIRAHDEGLTDERVGDPLRRADLYAAVARRVERATAVGLEGVERLDGGGLVAHCHEERRSGRQVAHDDGDLRAEPGLHVLPVVEAELRQEVLCELIDLLVERGGIGESGKPRRQLPDVRVLHRGGLQRERDEDDRVGGREVGGGIG